MVHALHEARRVLKPDGLILDLRPAAVHRRVGVTVAGRYRPVGAMQERLDKDRAANRAVSEVVRKGELDLVGRLQFECIRKMDTLAEFQVWMDEIVRLGKVSGEKALLRRLNQALGARDRGARIVVRGPLDLRVLTKRDASR